MTNTKGIVLIGMSGVGKTTLGPILARKLGWEHFDIDYMISGMRDTAGRPLTSKPISEDSSGVQMREMYKRIAKILARQGPNHMTNLEVETISSLDLHGRVISTPGTIGYDEACHRQLKDEATVVWLDLPLSKLIERLEKDPWRLNALTRSEIGFEALYRERRPTYGPLADLTITCEGKSPTALANEIIDRVGVRPLAQAQAAHSRLR